MSFNDLANKRYSVRSYKREQVEDDKLQQVLDSARLAPTAANRQAYQLIIIHTEAKQGELGRIYGRPWFIEAPIVICICGLLGEAWVRSDGKSYCDVDTAIVFDHLTLAAADLGLGTCWIGAFDAAAAQEVLGLPDDVEPIAFTPLGYPADRHKPKTRKPLNELVRYERW